MTEHRARNEPRKDWASARAAYVEGWVVDTERDVFLRNWPTFDEVATVHGISSATLHRRAAREGWVVQREEFQLDVDKARRQHLVEKRSEQVIRVDDRGLSNAEAGLGLIGMRLTFLLNQQSMLVQMDRGKGVDARELAALGLAAKRFLDVKAQIMGQPLTALENGMEDEERRARLDERRLAEAMVAFIAERATEDLEPLGV